ISSALYSRIIRPLSVNNIHCKGDEAMPQDKLEKETDGNPETVYEDLESHERDGFRTDDTQEIGDSEKLDGYSLE
ncbi:hypothetical protein, partial [Paenibacillus elgii]|uniref:hypothetical protein n=1 Tax=Paenibacillus elgii TaxID=189691 RepID=UPI001ED8FA5A